MKSRLSALCTLGAMGMVLAGCGTSLLGTGTPTPVPAASVGSTTTAPLNGEVAVAFPVVACTSVRWLPREPGVEALHPARTDSHRPGGQGRVLLRRGPHPGGPDQLELCPSLSRPVRERAG